MFRKVSITTLVRALMLSASALLFACSQEAPVKEMRSTLAAAGAQVLGLEPKAAPKPPQQKPAPVKAAAATQPAGTFKLESILAPDRMMRPGDYLWDDRAPAAGPLRIVVDIAAQRLYVYRGGIEIGRSSIIYGDDDKPTPYGTFPILQKNIDHVSNIYDAEMPYMMRLTWDGIAIHGSSVDEWSATNGCVGVPEEFAALLFAQAKLGDKVTVTNDWLPQIYNAQA